VPCQIVVHQTNTKRLRCFDVAFPFVGVLQRFKCTVHQKTFRLTEPKVADMAAKQHCNSSYVIFPRTIVTKAFLLQVSHILLGFLLTSGLYQVIALYNETFNFKKTARLIQQTWLSNLYAQILEVFVRSLCTETNLRNDYSATRKISTLKPWLNRFIHPFLLPVPSFVA
jgi:hypothetical protein